MNPKTLIASGFTLVELLLAASISALVLAGAYASLATVLSGYQRQAGNYANTDKARLILSRMSQDLAAAFLSPHQAVTRFVGTDNQNGLIAQDTLTFVSTIHDPTKTGAGTSNLTEIQFYIDMDGSTPEKWLLRRSDPTPDMDPFTGGQTALLGPNVISLNFEYYDGTAWWPTWDSAEELPIAVNVTIGIFEPSELKDTPSEQTITQYSKMIWLAHYREIPADQLSGAAGSTVGEEAAAGGGSDNQPANNQPNQGGGGDAR